MEHLTPEAIQRYLDGEADLPETDTITEHLACCPACSDLLAAIAADDEALTGALALEVSDIAWIRSVDLTESILRQATPLGHKALTWVLLLLLLTVAGLMAERAQSLLLQLSGEQGKMALVVSLVRSLVPTLWQLMKYLMQGGLAVSLWPLLLLGAAVFLRRLLKKEEEERYA